MSCRDCIWWLGCRPDYRVCDEPRMQIDVTPQPGMEKLSSLKPVTAADYVCEFEKRRE
jgi:hypothetical protein